MKIKNLFYYPVKSMGSIEVSELEFNSSGPKHDREWVLVDSEGTFVSQRRFPQLASVQMSLNESFLELTHSSGEKISVDLRFESEAQEIKIWKDQVKANSCDANTNSAISKWLGAPVRLFRYNTNSPRIRSKPLGEFETRFADGYQLLLTNTNSLNRLSLEIGENIPMNRFRPNIVIEAPELFEMKAKQVQIGSQKFKVMGPCQRCVMITIDQKTGAQTKSKALKHLAGWDPENHKPLFGIYLTAEESSGVISKNDSISFIS